MRSVTWGRIQWMAAWACLAGSLGLAGMATAQEKADPDSVIVPGRWYPTIETGINLTQGSYSRNWAGGDQGSITWAFITNAGLLNQLNTRVNWKNTLKLAFGQTHQQKLDPNTHQRFWDKPEKSTDLLDFETIFRFTLGGWVDPFVSGHFQSQFQDASDPAGRNLSLNPLRFEELAGVARQIVNTADQQLLTRVGFSLGENSRKVFTSPPPSRDTKTESTSDAGLQWVTDSKTRILQKRVAWTSKLIVFQPLHYSGRNDLRDAIALTPADTLAKVGIDRDADKFTTMVQADWENIFTSQITKLLSVSLYTRWVYQKYDLSVKPVRAADGSLADPAAVGAAIRKAGQFKETLSLGLTYRIL